MTAEIVTADGGAGAHATDARANGVVFDPLTRETLSAQIRDRLLERITSGDLEPGARVPSERALSEQFQVARTSVREAMQGLLSIGVIERRGNRSYVAEQLPDVTIAVRDDRKAFVQQLFETRRALELPIIELAAMRATPAERDEITALAAEFREGMDIDRFRVLDREFHSAIARACGNELLLELYGKVMAHLFRSEDIESLLLDTGNRAEVDEIVARATENHAAIAAAITACDARSAVAEGTRHLGAVEQGMINRLR